MDGMEKAAVQLVGMLRQGHRQAGNLLADIIALDDPQVGALFWYARKLAKELGIDPNDAYKAMMRAAGVKL